MVIEARVKKSSIAKSSLSDENAGICIFDHVDWGKCSYHQWNIFKNCTDSNKSIVYNEQSKNLCVLCCRQTYSQLKHSAGSPMKSI